MLTRRQHHDGPGLTRGAPSDQLGVSVIVGYKLVKAVAELVLGILLLSFGSDGVANELKEIARAIGRHATEAWSFALVARIESALTGRHVMILAWASVCDAVVSAFEAWALHRRYAWSRWLIVVGTACLLPFEVIALVRHAHVGRFVLLLVNVAIVVYLARRRVDVRAVAA